MALVEGSILMRVAVALTFLVSGASAHGWVQTPISKNEMQNHHYQNGMPDSLRWEPQTSYWGNNADNMMNGKGYSCGAKEASAAEGLATWQKWYDSAGVAIPSIKPGAEIPVKIKITADHGGQSWFMISCDDHIGEDVTWTYLERAQNDRNHHYMPSNPTIYAWATTEAASTMGSEIQATWVVPDNFTCSTNKVVGRWLWKTGSTCTDQNNVGRPTQKFRADEFAAVVHAFNAKTWVKIPCTGPPETFISCFDFVIGDSPLPPSPPSPTPPAPKPPPAPKNPTCCWSNWGADSACGEYTGPGGRCNTDESKTCNTNEECSKSATLYSGGPCPFAKGIVPICCWTKWGDQNSCANYTGPGAQCNFNHTKSCISNTDCPDKPAPAPTPPSPPSPSPKPPAPSGPIRGFWFGWVGAHSDKPAPSSGWFFSFPGLAVSPPFAPKDMGTILPAPVWGTYNKKILTQGGGDTSWGDDVYAKMKSQLKDYKPAGWDGVCWDWEKAGSDHTSAGFNDLMKATKAAGLINIVTSTAEGPYVWSASNNDARDIDWSLVDYFAPQMYGAAGTLPSEWKDYAKYWKDGANKPTLHNVTFGPIPMKKFLWGMPADTCDEAEKEFGGGGCIEWAYSPGVHPTTTTPPVVV